jgi:hypothetical protein
VFQHSDPTGSGGPAPSSHQLGHRSAEALLQNQERVIAVDESRSDLDRSFDTSRSKAHIDIAVATIERLGSVIVDAHTETHSIEAAGACCVLCVANEGSSNAVAPVFSSDIQVMDFWRIATREVAVPERLVVSPSHEVEPVTLVQPRQTENGCHRIDLSSRERSDVGHDDQSALIRFGTTRRGTRLLTLHYSREPRPRSSVPVPTVSSAI